MLYKRSWLLKHLLEHHEYDPTENDGFIQCLDCGEKIEDIQLFKVNFENDLLMISLSDPCLFSFFTILIERELKFLNQE